MRTQRLMAVSWVVLGFALATAALARAEDAESVEDRLADALRAELSARYPGTRIELGGEVHWTRGSLGADFRSVRPTGETPRGELTFSLTGAAGREEAAGWISFSAWAPARVAVKRVRPGEKVSAEQFETREMDVATGSARELRGVILDPRSSLAGLEARQTVLEGQMLLSTAVQRVPDVRRGDAVRVNLVSNGLSLTTHGIAEEPGYLDGQVRVMAGKQKRELVGKLMPEGVVEVRL